MNNVVAVRFIHGTNNRKYFFNNSFPDVKANDIVVVDAAGNFHLAKVAHVVKDANETTARKWVVDRVDLSTHKLLQNF